MSARLLTVAVVLLAHASSAVAQEDDLLAPLTPVDKGAKKEKKKEKKKEAPKPVPPKEELAASKLLVKLSDSLTGVVSNAKVFVDNKEVATLPMEPMLISPGEHKVLVKRDGYTTFTSTVKVRPGATSDVTVKLEAVAGVLSVSSDVVGAEVYVDGISQGPVPVTDLLLKPGEHELRLRRENYDEHVQALSVKAGRDYSFRIKLTPAATTVVARVDRPERAPPMLDPPKKVEPRAARHPSAIPPPAPPPAVSRQSDDTPWFANWYVWAGAAAVAGGATIGAVAMASQPPCVQPRADGSCWDAGINVPPGMEKYCKDSNCFWLPFLRFGGMLPK